MTGPTAEFVSLEGLRQSAPDWRDLCVRAAEPNPYAEPDFLLPLIAYEKPRRLAFALVWEEKRLIGFAALVASPLGLGLSRVWQSAYAALPAQVFDRDALPMALGALAKLLRRRVGIVWPLVERDGPLERELRGLRLPLERVASTRRAALRLAGGAAFDASLEPKRRKNWERQARRLATQGSLETITGAEAIEAFLRVEGKGWKGERGTALADDPARLAFARAALEAFARAGRLDALALVLNGQPIAAGLVLIAGPRGFYWKTGYDEAFSEASPGVQLTLAQSRRLADRPGLALLDSCASQDHPMIGRVWRDELAFDDWALGTGGTLRFWLWLERARAAARERLKRLVYRALGRKRS